MAPPISSVTPALLNTIVKQIIETVQPDKVILFGSHARGDATASSDLDLMVIMPNLNGQRRIDLSSAIRRNLSNIPVDKDIVVVTSQDITEYRDFSGYVIKPALQEGQVLYDAQQGQ